MLKLVGLSILICCSSVTFAEKIKCIKIDQSVDSNTYEASGTADWIAKIKKRISTEGTEYKLPTGVASVFNCPKVIPVIEKREGYGESQGQFFTKKHLLTFAHNFTGICRYREVVGDVRTYCLEK